MAKNLEKLQKKIDELLAEKEKLQEEVGSEFASRIAKDKNLVFLYTMDRRTLSKFAGVVCAKMPGIYREFKAMNEKSEGNQQVSGSGKPSGNAQTGNAGNVNERLYGQHGI